MLLHLFRITPEGRDDTFALASDLDHAAEIFTTYEIAHGRDPGGFAVERYRARTHAERIEDREIVRVLNSPGIMTFDNIRGWKLEPPC